MCFGKLAAVNDLSFEVEKGEVFGIAGPNGAGKTTLFNLISGFYQGSGDIIFDGANISRLKPYRICHKGIARTFQIPQLFQTLSVFENIRVGAHFGTQEIQNEDDNVKQVIDFVQLHGKENIIAANLNFLDKRLTMIAIALATRPKLLLLDEPIGGLSPIEVRQSVTLFQRINKELGVTIIIIEHLMKVLTEVSDRLLILHNGQKICLAPPKQVAEDEKVIEVYLGRQHA